MDMIKGLQRALSFIDENLTGTLTAQSIAAQANFSSFHFQRIFSALCGMTLFEYIRARWLTMAAQELSCGGARVLDVALKYGYDSPDSFARAFTRFHGISPSQAKEKGARLRAMAPLRITLNLEGGSIMEYRIVEKPAFTVMGVSREFNSDTSYTGIPKFWDEFWQTPAAKFISGMYGVCLDTDADGRFTYMIADNYIPWDEIPDGCTAHTVPAGTWAVFPCRGPLPETLQSINTRIWKEWLPALRDYRLSGRYNIEMYAPPCEHPEETYSEIWVPIEKA